MNVPLDVFTYHPVAALQTLSLTEVEALWELVPTERQRLYRAIYDRTRRDEGASGSDALEVQMVTQLLQRYSDKALVPVGAYWVPTPAQIQDAAKSDTPYLAVEPVEGAPKSKKLPLALMLIGVGCVLLFGFLVLRSATGKVTTLNTGTLTHTATPTLARTYTPTPFALDAQDAIIRGGSSGSSSSAVYPVNLRVTVDNAAQPRVFVVQRRIINTAEWNFDDDPDVASYLVGLSVHPVLGIPWSQANADLFQQAVPGSQFEIQMNTGVTLRFRCTTQVMVNRSDTNVFSQNRPGLTLVLFGDRSAAEQAQTENRLVLLADYVADPLTLFSSLALPTVQVPTPTVTATLVQRVDVQLITVTKQTGQLAVRLRVFNGRSTPVTLDSSTVWLVYGYSERPVGPRISAHLAATNLEPGQAADLTLVFAWHGEPFAMLNVFEGYSFALTLH